MRPWPVLILLLWLLLSLPAIGGAPDHALAHPNLKSCGRYLAGGQLSCRKDDCRLVVNRGSLAEMDFRLTGASWVHQKLSGQYVRTRIRVLSREAGALVAAAEEKAPLRAQPPWNEDDLKLLEVLPCEPAPR